MNSNLFAPHNPNLTIELTTDAFKIIIGEVLWYDLVQSNQSYFEMIEMIEEINQTQKDLKSETNPVDSLFLQHKFQEVTKKFFKNLEQFETEDIVAIVEKRVGFDTEEEIRPTIKEDLLKTCRRNIVQKRIRILLDIHEAALSLRNELNKNDVDLSAHLKFLQLNETKEQYIDYFLNFYQSIEKELVLLGNFKATLKKIVGEEEYKKIKRDPKKIIEELENTYATYNQKYENLCKETKHLKIKLNQPTKTGLPFQQAPLTKAEIDQLNQPTKTGLPFQQAPLTKEEIDQLNQQAELRVQKMRDEYEALEEQEQLDKTKLVDESTGKSPDHNEPIYDGQGNVVGFSIKSVPTKFKLYNQQITKEEIDQHNQQQELRAKGMKDGFEAGNRGAMVDTSNRLSLEQVENIFPNQNPKIINQKYSNQPAYIVTYQKSYQESYQETLLEQAAILGRYQGMGYGVNLVQHGVPYQAISSILEPKYQKFNGTDFADVYLEEFNRSAKIAYYQFEKMLEEAKKESFLEEEIVTSRKK